MASSYSAVADSGEVSPAVCDFKEGSKGLIVGGLFICLLLTIAGSAVVGPFGLKLTNVLDVLAAHLLPGGDVSAISRLHNTVVWDIRMPRILLATGVGAALAISGGVFQGCFKNPLVEPYILGASSGAAFGAALAIVLPTFLFSLQLSAFVFSLVAVFGAYGLARVRGETPIVTLILAGVIVGALFSAMLSILKYLAADAALREIVFWLMGGFYYAVWKDVELVLPVVLAITFLLLTMSWKLNIISMGDEEARTLGINPEFYKSIFILLATLMTALSVSVVGIIAWVGLMMPHAARMIIGPDHRFMLPAAAIMGSMYLVFCDTLSRNLTTSEIPVGIVASILGAPYLIYLLRSKGKSAFGG
ncbi:FecCD family ABC transporter permease [Maridesulfovibrio salexigens]|uniref:Transport system permease protein n=1 Tax=Maridesulfovibrio salexigens (strain ATCC 14822 / DSM 2638 / NCIMB 8403 / VKM B-1763) TaxID=526222 RepID=C6BVE0_MARSD|nr:iron ABC transporter permease [Maridesulfovibrio salexigens]ACS80115.1 transport system permease protein [Maridesulfovibrio salexigens DSM 2638]